MNGFASLNLFPALALSSSQCKTVLQHCTNTLESLSEEHPTPYTHFPRLTRSCEAAKMKLDFVLAILVACLTTLVSAAPAASSSDLALLTPPSSDLARRNTSTTSANPYGYQVFCYQPAREWNFWSCLLPPYHIRPAASASADSTSTPGISTRTVDYSIALNVIQCLTSCNCDRCGRMSCDAYFDCTSQEVLSVCLQVDKGHCGCISWGSKRDVALNGTEADVDAPAPHCR